MKNSKNNFQYFFTFLLLIASFIASSQNRTIVQMEIADEETETKSSGISDITLKVNPTLLFRGDLPLYVEASVYKNIRIEAGIGITLRDYWGEIVDESFLSSDKTQAEYSNSISTRIGIKFYPSDYSYLPEGYFFGIEHRYQDYKTKLIGFNDLKVNSNLVRKYNDIRFLAGYSKYFDDNLFVEFYGGFGLRNRRVDIPSGNENVNGNFKSFSIEEESKTVLLISAGIKFGVLL